MQRGLCGDRAGMVQLQQAAVHRAHLVFGRGVDDAVDLVRFIVADHIADGGCHDHDLKGRDHVSVDRRNELLGDDGTEHHRELHRDLVLLGRFEDIDDPADRVRGSDCVKAGEDEVSGLCGGHCGLDRLMVAHLTEQDDIRALAQRSAQCRQIIVCISRDLTLADDAFFMAVQEFEWILQCDDVIFPRGVDAVDQAGESRRFAASGRAGDKEHALCEVGQLQDRIRDAEQCRIRKFKCDDPDHSGEGATLLVRAHTVTGQSGDRKREIIVAGFQERFHFPVLRQCVDLPDQHFGGIRHEPFAFGVHESVYFIGQWASGYDKNVGCVCIGSGREHIGRLKRGNISHDRRSPFVRKI